MKRGQGIQILKNNCKQIKVNIITIYNMPVSRGGVWLLRMYVGGNSIMMCVCGIIGILSTYVGNFTYNVCNGSQTKESGVEDINIT